MHNYLSRKEYESLKKDFLSFSINKSNLEKSISELAKEIEEICLSIICNDAQVENVLWIFHQARINNKNNKIKLTLNKFIHETKKYIKLSETEIISGKFEETFNSLVRISILKIMEENRGIAPSIGSCLTESEKLEINNRLNDYSIREADDSLLEIEQTKQFEILNKFIKYDNLLIFIMHIKKLQNIAISNDNKASIAAASLNYLLDENDVIPDLLGIVGLVDDFYAIKQGLKLTDENNDFTSLVKMHDERYGDFRLPNVEGTKKDINIINIEKIIKASYIKNNEDNLRRLIVLRNVGNIPVYSAIGKSLTDRIEFSENRIKKYSHQFNEGDEIFLGYEKGKFYGNQTAKPIVARYLGSFDNTKEMIPDVHMIEGKDGKITLRNEFINNCKANNDEYPISSIKKINNFVNGSTREVLPWRSTSFCAGINSIPSKGKIFIFGSKNIYQPMFSEKIFGKKIEEWFGLRIIDRNWRNIDTKATYLFPEPQINLVFDKDVAYRILEDRWGNDKLKTDIDLIISPDDFFNEDEYYLQLLSNFPKDILAFTAFYNGKIKKEFANYEYDILAAKTENIISYLPDSITTQTEKYLFRTQDFIKKLVVTNPDTILEKLRKAIPKKVEQDNVIMKIRLRSFILNRSTRIMPLDEESLIVERQKLNDIMNDLEHILRFSDEFSSVEKLINQNFEEIVNFCKLNIILDEVKKIDNQENIIGILSLSSETKKLNNFFKTNQFKNILALSFSDLKKNFGIDTLIIPYFRRRKESVSLRNEKFARKHIFMMSESEAKVYQSMEEYEKKLLDGNKLSFNEDDNFEYQINELNELTDDLLPFNEIMQNSKKLITSHSVAQKEIEINCKLFMFEDLGIHIVPENGSKLISKNSDEGKITYAKILNLEPGDKILISTNTSNVASDLLKTIVIENGNIEEYLLLEKRAKLWQSELLKFARDNSHLSVKDLQVILKKKGLKKDVVTIRNWLNDKDIIIPKFRESVIQGIFELRSNFNTSQIEDCLDANNHMISLRSKAREILQGKISEININEDQQSLSISLGKLNLDYDIKEIVSVSDSLVSSRFLYKTITNEALNNREI